MNFFFKKYASFLFDVLLEQRTSAYNPILNLYLSKGQLKLVTKGAVYSYGIFYYNFRDSFRHIGIAKKKIQNVLILGLGTGSIIQLLEQKFDVNAKYHIVEIDPDVVALFEKYTSEFIVSPYFIDKTDAFQYLNANDNKYDLICMDIFCDRTVPEIFESEIFLHNLKNALEENGILLYNRLAIDSNDQNSNERFFEIFQKIFPEATIFKMEYNWMFVAKNA